jgi:hypothetical protein
MNCLVPSKIQRLPCRRAGLDCRCVGASLRLRQAEAGEHLSFGHRHQKAALLILRAVLQHRHAADRVLHGKDRRDRALARRDLLHYQCIADMVGASPAIFLRYQHAHKAEPAEFSHRFDWKRPLAIPLRRIRSKPLTGKIAGHIAQHLLLVGEPHRSPALFGGLVFKSPQTVAEPLMLRHHGPNLTEHVVDLLRHVFQRVLVPYSDRGQDADVVLHRVLSGEHPLHLSAEEFERDGIGHNGTFGSPDAAVNRCVRTARRCSVLMDRSQDNGP